MSRIGSASLAALPVLMALASSAACAQQLQRPATTASPATQPATLKPQAPVPANPSQRASPATPIPSAGPASTQRPMPSTQPMPMPEARTPTPVRDAQGRIVPGAQNTLPGSARDPVTGQDFQTSPVVRPH